MPDCPWTPRHRAALHPRQPCSFSCKEALAKKQAVDFIFKDTGRLGFRKSRVQAQFPQALPQHPVAEQQEPDFTSQATRCLVLWKPWLRSSHTYTPHRLQQLHLALEALRSAAQPRERPAASSTCWPQPELRSGDDPDMAPAASPKWRPEPFPLSALRLLPCSPSLRGLRFPALPAGPSGGGRCGGRAVPGAWRLGRR